MLPRAHRLTRPEEFRRVSRRGRRSGRDALVVHALVAGGAASGPSLPARVGFAVGRSVGNSVVRHRVVRRLRHLLHARVADWPAGAEVVVRARPAAGTASSAALAHELDRALRRVGLPPADPAGTTSRGRTP